MTKYKIHFTDQYGSSTVECETISQYEEMYDNINKDPLCSDIWTEYYDPEEGWQA